jgi:hypothetical protein
LSEKGYVGSYLTSRQTALDIPSQVTMHFGELAKAIVTDSHFLIPLVVFVLGLALLFLLR